MAEEIKVIRVGDILTNLIDPVTKLSVQYSKVLNWYDGTPMTDAKLDSYGIYVKKGSEYFLKSLGEYGQVLQKNTMTEMRNLSGLEILLLKMGYYNSVQLNGYYQEGDTPAPINYIISTTAEEDDGGSVIEVGGIKLEHIFIDNNIHGSYFGIVPNRIQNITTKVSTIKNLDYDIINIIIPKGSYTQGRVTLTGKSNITIDYSNSTITYDSLNGSLNFYCENGSNITIKNGTFIGRMFEGLNRETVSGIPVDESKVYQSANHRFCTFIGSDNIEIQNIKIENFSTALDFRTSQNIIVDNVKGSYLNTGLRFLRTNGVVRNTIFEDCRFDFSRYYESYSTSVTTAQGSGMLIDLPENGDVLIDNCKIYRCWTNGYRVEGYTGKVVFRNCDAIQCARHGFSVYGAALGKQHIEMYSCNVLDHGDPSFYTGDLENATYKVPHREGSVVCFSVSGLTSTLLLDSCNFSHPTYQGGEPPIRTDTLNGIVPATVPYCFLKTQVSSSVSDRHDNIIIRNCSFEGFTNPKEHSVYITDVRGKGTSITDLKIINRSGSSNNYPLVEGVYQLRVESNDALVHRVYSYGSAGGIFVQGGNALNKFMEIKDSIVEEPFYNGIRSISTQVMTPIVQGNLVKNCRGYYYTPGLSVFLNNTAISTLSSVEGYGLNIAFGQISEPLGALAVNSLNVIGNITAKHSQTSSVTGRQVFNTRLKIDGNVPDNPEENDLITFSDLLSTTAGVGRSGVVRKVPATPDTATPASGETPTKAEFDALLAELRDLKTKMRQGVAPILVS